MRRRSHRTRQKNGYFLIRSKKPSKKTSFFMLKKTNIFLSKYSKAET